MQIAIIFGGVSFEHEISIVSAIALKKVLSCEVKYIFCDKSRDLYLIDKDNLKAKFFSSGDYKKEPKLYFQKEGFFQKTIFGQKSVELDVVLNLIHGADGEDGTIAGIFDFFDIKYIGPRVDASVLSFNKLYTKLLCKELKVKALDYEIIKKGDQPKIPFPIIIKPLRLGSSIGINVVKNQDSLQYALDVGFEYDDTLLVEPFIDGIKEYNLAGCKAQDGFIFSVIEEPQKDEVLDFDKKYKDFSRTQKVFEANLSIEIIEKMQKLFKTIYEPLFLGSMIRCDFFVLDNEIYLNEINPNPGSMANYLYDDFNKAVQAVADNLPKKYEIKINYDFIHSINSAKGKA